MAQLLPKPLFFTATHSPRPYLLACSQESHFFIFTLTKTRFLEPFFFLKALGSTVEPECVHVYIPN